MEENKIARRIEHFLAKRGQLSCFQSMVHKCYPKKSTKLYASLHFEQFATLIRYIYIFFVQGYGKLICSDKIVKQKFGSSVCSDLSYTHKEQTKKFPNEGTRTNALR